MFPCIPGLARHYIERSRLGRQRKALPGGSGLAPEAELAGGVERQAKDLIEMRLVAMPADPHPFIIFGAQDLADGAARRTGEGFDPGDEGLEPFRDVVGLPELALAVIIAPAEGSDGSVSV